MQNARIKTQHGNSEKKKGSRLSSPHSSEFLDQMRSDDLDQRKGSLSQVARPSNSGEKE